MFGVSYLAPHQDAVAMYKLHLIATKQVEVDPPDWFSRNNRA
jgi:hypothetical protein